MSSRPLSSILLNVSQRSQTMDEGRFHRWVYSAYALFHVVPYMVSIVQGLGKLDAKLVREDSDYLILTPKERKHPDVTSTVYERVTISYLWVLGAYEIIRALDQRFRKNPSLAKEAFRKRVNELKKKYARLRMPLAKLEPSNKYRNVDGPIAFPAMHKDLGVSWQIADNTYINRQELSDEFLQFLEDYTKDLKDSAG